MPFRPDMTVALIKVWKTQTRRIMAIQPDCKPNIYGPNEALNLRGPKHRDCMLAVWQGESEFDNYDCHCPYGAPGDLLWVREAWKAGACADGFKPSELHPDFWLKDNGGLWYLADDTVPIEPITTSGRYRHARFMPRWASRLTLRITDVRVERVQDISEEDAVAEGIWREKHNWNDPELPIPDIGYKAHAKSRWISTSPSSAFHELWDSINGNWDENLWVWVIAFEVIRANVDDVLREAIKQ
ncbi:MAG: hypothetical protein AAGI44_13335 [Pseudomonadota bacterium]